MALSVKPACRVLVYAMLVFVARPPGSRRGRAMTAGLTYAHRHSIAASGQQRRLTPEEVAAELFETAPDRTIFTARLPEFSATRRWTPTTGSPTVRASHASDCALKISAASWAGRCGATGPSSSYPMSASACASLTPGNRQCRRLRRGRALRRYFRRFCKLFQRPTGRTSAAESRSGRATARGHPGSMA